MKNVSLLLFIVAAAFVLGFGLNMAAAAETRHKPMPPLTITISPVSPETAISPGGVAQFRAVLVASIELPDVHLRVKVQQGAELVSGETEWSGPLKKREEKILIFSVRASSQGKGKIVARADVKSEKGRPLIAESRYQIRSETTTGETKPEHALPKDSKGRDVIEYR